MCVLQVAALEGVDLALEVGEGVGDLGPPAHQLGQLLPGVDVGHALLGGHCPIQTSANNTEKFEKYICQKSKIQKNIFIYITNQQNNRSPTKCRVSSSMQNIDLSS